MDEEIGKWLLDISKYIITAYILSQMFGKDNDSWWSFIGAVLLAVLLFALGYYLIKKEKIKIRKGSKMSNGLLAMYIFLAVFATGLVIYSKMSDRKDRRNKYGYRIVYYVWLFVAFGSRNIYLCQN